MGQLYIVDQIKGWRVGLESLLLMHGTSIRVVSRILNMSSNYLINTNKMCVYEEVS